MVPLTELFDIIDFDLKFCGNQHLNLHMFNACSFRDIEAPSNFVVPV